MSKILLIDSYDSYTYNLLQLLIDTLPAAEVIVVRNDQFDPCQIEELLRTFDFVVIGPGPGDPRNVNDRGSLLNLFDYDVPILGVCLGFQLICMYAGGQIQRLKTPKHGQVSALHTRSSPMYPANNSLQVTRYHSLYASIAECTDLVETAWVEDDKDNGHVAMSVMHKDKPFIGVQYHPESACSERGPDLIRRFNKIAVQWNKEHRPDRSLEISPVIKSQTILPRPLVDAARTVTRSVEWLELDYVLSSGCIAELLGVKESGKFILMDAAAEPSRFSILGCLSGHEDTVTYRVGQNYLLYNGHRHPTSDRISAWHFIAQLMQERLFVHGPSSSPFWGGLAGYLSYESGVESLDVVPLPDRSLCDDISMIFIDRSIVVDHKEDRMYIQSLRAGLQDDLDSDDSWLRHMSNQLRMATQNPPVSPRNDSITSSLQVQMPDKDIYLRRILDCQQYLAEGQSYELCLTAQTQITCSTCSPWELYQTLRARNPSPFASFMRLPGIHLLSSSPERFLSWSREGACQLRPIKGTVRKVDGMTLSKATEILRDPKEYAENLMIVDLIRHDLHQIAKRVQVPTLMQVEEYHTVYQLVSVITGQIEAPFTGFDVLSRSMPPGSMTGAPKKRSVELLQRVEGQRRGIYSGVCGYLSVCGGGDWSVVIRSAFRYDAENEPHADSETWWIGAGGAITALSDPEAEWAEMLAKLQSTLPCFGNPPAVD